MRKTLLTVCALFLTLSCVARQQKQNAADAVAGIAAMEQVAPSMALVADGAKHYTAAAVKTKLADLPAPTMQPDMILANQKSYQEAGHKAEKDATSGLWAWILGGAGTALVLAARFAPFLGPLGATVGAIANGLTGLITPAKVQQARKRAETMEQTAWRMVETIEGYDSNNPVIREMKKKIAAATPDDFKALFARWKAERQA